MDFRRWMDSMRTRTALVLFLTSVVAGGLLVLALAAAAAPKTVASKAAPKTAKGETHGVAWRDLGAALDEAKSTQKRIVVDVYTDWCGWCRRMDRDTYGSPDVQKYLGEAFVPVKLNAESSKRVLYRDKELTYRELASGFRVNGYPTTLFLEADGSHIVTAPGYMKAPDFLSVLRYIGEGHYKSKDFQRYRTEQGSASDATTGSR